MNQPAEGAVLEREIEVSPDDVGALAMLNRSEINMQIATARRFPRSVSRFVSESTSLVSLSEEVAEECIYALPRDGKTIEGPSARFAEIIAYSWGNCRSAARVVDEAGEFVTAQGVHWDLEKNTAIGYEVKRRIVDKQGRRFKPDMIGVTANAACSIALRNAILKGVPKALWTGIYQAARRTIMGDFQSLANRRAAALEAFQKFGVKPEQVFEKLGIRGEEDISLDHIVVLRGLLTALRDGDTTVEDAFPVKQAEPARGAGASLKEAVKGKQAKPQGTPELMEKFLNAFKECADVAVLELKRDEALLHDWSPAHRQQLEQAFYAQEKVLREPPAGIDVADYTAKLDELASAEAISEYAEGLPEEVRNDERFAKAVKKRLEAIAAAKKKR